MSHFKNAIEIHNLTKKFPASSRNLPLVALDNVDLTIPKGCLFGLLGPNGAGKSTLINILAGLFRKTSGQVWVSVPRLIKRGEIVTLKIMTPFMQITTKGRALQDGAHGESVRVTNTRSKKIIEGVVIESGVVRVGAIQQMASAK